MKKVKTLALIFDNRRIIFWSLFALLTVVFVTYAFFLNRAIMSVVYVEEHQKEVIAMRGELSELEQKYLASSGSVTLAKAHELGFVDDNSPTYIKAPSSISEVSLSSN